MITATVSLTVRVSAVPCPLPKRPDNGKYEQSRDPLNPGDTLSVTCERGYYVSGVTTVTCMTGRKFSGDIPRCRRESDTLCSRETVI